MARHNTTTTKTEIRRYLRENGISPLTHRVALYSYLLENRIHPTAEQVYQGLKPSVESISRTTVYNILNLFSERNIIKRVDIEKNEMRFDVNTTNHIHFKCRVCQKVVDLPQEEFPQLRFSDHFLIEEIQINVQGVCPPCQK